FVGLDVGGSSMKAVVVDDAGQPLADPVNLPTEAHLGQENALKRMSEPFEPAAKPANPTMKAGPPTAAATPGPMDIPTARILDPPNLKPWQNVPVRQHIADAFGLPTAFQNDANAAAYGEYWAGAGRGSHSLVLFTLGTGIGGGIIIDHMILEGEHSYGGEL